jgi:hypothetical protein
MKKIILKSLIGLIFILSFTAYSNEKVINFNSEQDLKDFYPAQTGDRGTLSKWKIVEDKTAPSGNKAVRVFPDPETNHGSVFNLLIYKKVKAKDLKLSVMIKAVEGREDQGGGLIWRAKDKNNYYIVRWNPLEDNFTLYYVKNAHRRVIIEVPLKADPSKWHQIKVVQKGNIIECYFDKKLKIKRKHRLFKNTGYVGLWTKADASSEFDNLYIKVIEK